jgi:hypothetical protein
VERGAQRTDSATWVWISTSTHCDRLAASCAATRRPRLRSSGSEHVGTKRGVTATPTNGLR